MRARWLATAVVLVAASGGVASAGHFYGEPSDAPVDAIDAIIFGNGSATGVLAASAPQPNEGFDHVVFYANAGDLITVDTNGSDQDSGLSILEDIARDGIVVGDSVGSGDLLRLDTDDDGGIGLDSLISFTATYSGAYLASLAEIGGREMNWVLNVNGSSFVGPVVPEPTSLALLATGGIGLVGGAIRRRRQKNAA